MTLSGSPFDYLFAFSGGVLMSFTPCVYPLVPVVVAYIGAPDAGSKIKGLFLSLSYVTGIAVTYSALGLFASLSGTLFGKISTSPVTYIFVGSVIIVFGLSMLDLFTIALPGIKRPALGKKNYFGVFILGLISGFIISPCLTPALGSILAYLAAKKNLFYGATLLFTFAYGMGLVLILAGSSSAFLLSLPKSGKWMLYIKRSCAFILIGLGIYFLASGLIMR